MSLTNKIVLIIGLILYQSVSATKYAGDFEEFGVSARAIGLGGAYVAVVEDPSAIYYNPGASVRIKKTSILLMHAESFGGVVMNNFLGMVIPGANQSFGLGVLHNGVPGIKLTTVPDTTQPPSDTNRPYPKDTVNANHLVFYLNYSHRLLPNFQLGTNAKLIYQTYGVSSCFGMGVDIGGVLTLFDGFRLGLRIRNLTTSPLFWATNNRESILPRFAFGLARTFTIGQDQLLLSLELEGNTEPNLADQRWLENFGIEYVFKNLLAVRFGMYHRLITFGLGINYKRFFIDYSYQSGYFNQSRDLGGSQRISGGLKF